MRAVIYSRYSSDQQRATSIDDQIRLCKERIAREGWTLAQVYRDAAMSGATALRPGYQAMLDGAREAAFVVVAEALDRLSRDQEDIAALFKRLLFAEIRLEHDLLDLNREGIPKGARVRFKEPAGFGGRHAWLEPILWTFGSGWLRRWRRANPAVWWPRRSWSASRAW
jgi:hypothetical protein